MHKFISSYDKIFYKGLASTHNLTLTSEAIR
jgi:hypothetical protein